MRKLFKHIGMICLALAVAVGSFFVPIRKPNRSQMASADVVTYDYTYNGSSIYVPILRSLPAGYKKLDLFTFYPSFSRNGDNFTLTLSDTSRILVFDTIDNDNYRGAKTAINHNVDTSTYSNSFTIPISNFVGSYYGRVLFSMNYSYDDFYYQYPIWLYSDSIEFNGNIRQLRLYSNSFTINSVTTFYNVISYIDNNGHYLNFMFALPDNSFVNAVFTDRTYYFDQNVSDSDIYNQGYNAGLSANQSTIYDSGYESGYNDGFDNGKIQGVADANDYSFVSLFGGLFDAPVALLMGLLNFEFLGINLWAFVTSLFTLALVLFIVKLIMGR